MSRAVKAFMTIYIVNCISRVKKNTINI